MLLNADSSSIEFLTELAACAGFFNGEGGTTAHNRTIGHREYVYISMHFSQTGEDGEDILVRCNHALGGIGEIYGPYPNGHRKDGSEKDPAYQLYIYGFEKIQAAIAMMWPWLSGVKKQQYLKVVERKDYVDARRSS